MPNTDTTNLERHRQKWRVIVKVPVAARAKIGKAHLKESLNTHNLDTANLLKPPVVMRFKAIIEEALREVQPNDYHEEAKAIREARKLHAPKGTAVQIFPRPGDEDEVEADLGDAGHVDAIATELERSHGEDYARAFAQVALGQATPIKDHLQDFKDDNDYQTKSLLELDGAFKRLLAWLSDTKRPQTLEGVTREVAETYLRHLVNGVGISPKTAGKYVSFFRSYWKWLGRKKLVEDGTVWAVDVPKGKSVRRHSDAEPDEGKRPFTMDEMKKLVNGADGDMRTLITLGALTGMRIEEIYGLRVRDVVEGFIHVRMGKTNNAKRKVPIHSDLKGTVAALTEGKEPTSYLFEPDAPVIEKTGLRSGAASKRFGHFRRGLGLDERPNGKLKSNIDFHSLRRWFIAQARDGILNGDTSYNMWTIADVVGHGDDLTDTLKMTLGVYPGKSADAALRACVAAVQLPA